MPNAADRAEALRREAERCRALALQAWNPVVRQELIEMAARFDRLAKTTAMHDFGAIMQAATVDIVGRQPVAQQQQQIQPKKEE
jgi:hypothetical protein